MVKKQTTTTTARKANTATLLDDLNGYDLVVVSFSGGKDSTACVLDLIERGVDRDRLELWHQDVDGNGKAFVDWPVTRAYCQAFADALGINIRFQHKDGGFRGEMLRDNERTAGVTIDGDDGPVCLPASTQAKAGTRRRFPQVSADLRVRWCSSYLKIDVAARAITNDPRLVDARVLFVTGERAEESPNRARYALVEKHRTSTRRRVVDHWRIIGDWTEADVWGIIERWKVTPHPAYFLGFGRCSCMACIFGNADQWATVRDLAPDRVAEIADYEIEFASTIDRRRSVTASADAGQVYPAASSASWRSLAMGTEYRADQVLASTPWSLPSGAFQTCGGPN